MEKMPKWADATLVPLISLLLAAILSALVILAIGEDPVAALKLMATCDAQHSPYPRKVAHTLKTPPPNSHSLNNKLSLDMLRVSSETKVKMQ